MKLHFCYCILSSRWLLVCQDHAAKRLCNVIRSLSRALRKASWWSHVHPSILGWAVMVGCHTEKPGSNHQCSDGTCVERIHRNFGCNCIVLHILWWLVFRSIYRCRTIDLHVHWNGELSLYSIVGISNKLLLNCLYFTSKSLGSFLEYEYLVIWLNNKFLPSQHTTLEWRCYEGMI